MNTAADSRLLIAGGVAAIIAGAGIGNLFDSDNSILGDDATQVLAFRHLRGRDYPGWRC